MEQNSTSQPFKITKSQNIEDHFLAFLSCHLHALLLLLYSMIHDSFVHK